MATAAQLELLRKLVDCDKDNGYFRTLMDYNPFGSRPVGLNFDVESMYGTVDVDWMLRIAWAAKFEFIGWMTFRTAKFYWNLIDPRRGGLRRRLNPSSIMGSANERAVTAAHAWANGKRLTEIFSLALR